MQIDHIQEIAVSTSADLGNHVTDGGVNPVEVAIGGIRGSIAFWLGCTKEGQRVESLNVMRQIANEEIDNLIRGIANGMLEA
jgi:hypothetical protein